jgi:hypothetical protein
MEVRIGLNNNLSMEFPFKLFNALSLLIIEEIRHSGMNADNDLLILLRNSQPPDLPEDLITDGHRRLGIPPSFAIAAGLTQDP